MAFNRSSPRQLRSDPYPRRSNLHLTRQRVSSANRLRSEAKAATMSRLATNPHEIARRNTKRPRPNRKSVPPVRKEPEAAMKRVANAKVVARAKGAASLRVAVGAKVRENMDRVAVAIPNLAANNVLPAKRPAQASR